MILNFKSTPLITKTTRNIDAPEISTYFQTNIPSRLIEFWKSYNEVSFENGINIYGFDIAIERNGLYEVSTYAPEYILIGDDGGGQGLFLKKNSDLNVFYQDFGALSLPFYTLDTDLFRWLENDPLIEDDFTLDEPDLIDKVKVYVVRKPNEANKFIMEIRKCFNLNLSINDIKEKLNSLPFLVIQDITIMKYIKTIEILNQKYNCIEVRNSKNVIIISPEKN
ncbi:hypothetical protein LYSIN_01509 [Lysinibacillus sphaericus]|uniref:SMI1/KNR4 family protein n=1 Tax=Lysinibacillus sphaericus TaxID=1421 RepID=A0A2S5D0Y3_LYSSH|nr:hypothetical protein [Lysinibacillus sphaericus]POZ56726.1 hypothetical protein LYSIN_01509 [Lysinibacillus sphaericus]